MAFKSEQERIARAIARFDTYVVNNGENYCWDWTGSDSGNGYGCMRFPQKVVSAHRIRWTIHYGPIPKGMHVLHKCDVKECTNPKHLYLGTNADNMRDKRLKGRSARLRGDKSPSSILTEKKVGRIKTLLKKGVKVRVLAEKYKVSKGAIENIKRGNNWKTVKSS